jgi:hypothetical protein
MREYKIHKYGNGWEAYYDRSLRLWVGLQKDAEGNCIPQYEGGQTAVYGVSSEDVVRHFQYE